MVNLNVFSGHVIGSPKLILAGENAPMTFFTLSLIANQQMAGRISVVCHQHLALIAARHLSNGDYVVIEGYLRLDYIPAVKMKYDLDFQLFALEILKCEVLGL